MKLHANAQTCPHCRTLIVESVINDRRSVSEVAASFRVSAVTVHKWLRRYRAEGRRGCGTGPPVHIKVLAGFFCLGRSSMTQLWRFCTRRQVLADSTERLGE